VQTTRPSLPLDRSEPSKRAEFSAQFFQRGTKNRLADPSEIWALEFQGNFDDPRLVGFTDDRHRLVDPLRFIEHTAGKRHHEKIPSASATASSPSPIRKSTGAAAPPT
jgi:hypothetical protein